MSQLLLPFHPPIFPKHRPKPPKIHFIPRPAAHRIFAETWSEYSAFLEAEQHHPDIFAFITDVEAQIRNLYPHDLKFVLSKLLHDSSSLPATRQALGEAFLAACLWPVKSYFGH